MPLRVTAHPTSLPVQDLGRTRGFYEQVLGLCEAVLRIGHIQRLCDVRH